MVFRRSRVTYPLFYPKRSGKKESGSRASIVRVFGFVYNPRFSLFYRKKEVGSKELDLEQVLCGYLAFL